MDVILEILDTFVFDRLYATILPASASTIASQFLQNAATSTFSSMREGATMLPKTQYSYHPSTQYFTLTPSEWAYKSTLARDNMYRQAFSLFLITWIFGGIVYFVFSSMSYYFIFDKETFKHPKYLKNQVSLEIRQTLIALPFMSILTLPFFFAEVRGYSKLYDATSDAPFPLYNYLQFPLFILFTDFFIYWIHRGLHHPMMYKRLHKPHHKWIVPTPYASHAFHPVDGWMQSLPYHFFPFIFPLQKFAYVALFVFINIWTIMIHDGEYVANSPMINGAACHTMHHLYFNYNYGEFTTTWDRLWGSYRKPNAELFQKDQKMGKDEWERQTKEMEQLVKQVEGDDDRQYGEEAKRIAKKMM